MAFEKGVGKLFEKGFPTFFSLNHNHPSNGWFALGLKAHYYRPAAWGRWLLLYKSTWRKLPSPAGKVSPEWVTDEEAKL